MKPEQSHTAFRSQQEHQIRKKTTLDEWNQLRESRCCRPVPVLQTIRLQSWRNSTKAQVSTLPVQTREMRAQDRITNQRTGRATPTKNLWPGNRAGWLKKRSKRSQEFGKCNDTKNLRMFKKTTQRPISVPNLLKTQFCANVFSQ